MFIDIVTSLRRDLLAALASEEDYLAHKSKIPKILNLVKNPDGSEKVEGTIHPDNWRIIARYLHADEMMKHADEKNLLSKG